MAIVSYHGSMTAWIPSCVPISDTLFYVLASEPCVSFFVVCRLVIIDLLVIQDSNVPYIYIYISAKKECPSVRHLLYIVFSPLACLLIGHNGSHDCDQVFAKCVQKMDDVFEAVSLLWYMFNKLHGLAGLKLQ